MKRSWESLSSSIEKMVARKKQKGRVPIFKTAQLHAKIWIFFRNGRYDNMNDELDRQLRFYCNDLVTLRKPDISSFRQVNNLLTTLFHSPRVIKPGFQILQDRIRELRRIENVRNKIIQRNYLLGDQQRGTETTDDVMSRVYALPPEVFKILFCYL